MSGVVRLAKRRNRPSGAAGEAVVKEREAIKTTAKVEKLSTNKAEQEVRDEEQDKENQSIHANTKHRQSSRLKAKTLKQTASKREPESDSEDSDPSSSSSSSDGEDGIYEVQSILDRRERRGRVEYKIQWKRNDEITWEPKSNLTGCQRLLTAFEEQLATSEPDSKASYRRGRRSVEKRRRGRPRTKSTGGSRAATSGESSDEDKRVSDTCSDEEGPRQDEECEVRVSYRCGVRTEQGHRPENQDSYLVPSTAVASATPFNMFAVLDGHGEKGRFASERGVEILRDLVPRYYEEVRTQKAPTNTKSEVWRLEQVMKRSLAKVDEELRADGEACKEEYGTTAVVCVQKDQDLVIANVGDSKAVLFREAGASSRDKILEIITTTEHKASNRREAARIWAEKGQISKDQMVYPSEDDAHRSGLAMTRALGHAVLSKYGVVGTPDCYSTTIRDKDMLVIACDGLWDVLNTREVTRLVASLVKESKDPQAIASALIERAERKWIKGLGKGRVADNITAIVVVFRVA